MNHHTTFFALSAFSLVACAATPRASSFEVHVRTIPEAAFVNTVMIETSDHVVAIDAGFSEADARAIEEIAAGLGKPLRAVLLTHAHIDHYGGAYHLRGADVPIIAGASVARHLDEYDAINHARFGGVPPTPPLDIDVLGNGGRLVVDGVTFELHEVGPGEAHADTWWLVSHGDRHAAVIGDLAMYGIPPFLQSGQSGPWIRSLARLRDELPADAEVYIGHDLAGAEGAAPPRGAEILDWQIARLTAFRRAVADVTGRTRLLTAAEVDQVVERLHEDAPENRTDFDFLIRTSANVLAAELILELERERFEAALRAFLSGAP